MQTARAKAIRTGTGRIPAQIHVVERELDQLRDQVADEMGTAYPKVETPIRVKIDGGAILELDCTIQGGRYTYHVDGRECHTMAQVRMAIIDGLYSRGFYHDLPRYSCLSCGEGMPRNFRDVKEIQDWVKEKDGVIQFHQYGHCFVSVSTETGFVEWGTGLPGGGSSSPVTPDEARAVSALAWLIQEAMQGRNVA